MMKLTKVLMAATIMLLAVSTNAQFKKPVKFGVGFSGILPAGMSGIPDPISGTRKFEFGGGLDLKFGIKILPTIGATISGGINGMVSAKGLSGGKADGLLVFPVKVGVQYFFIPKVYAALELGATQGTLYHYYIVGTDDKLDSYKVPSSFTFAPGIGAHLASFDLSIRYEHFSQGGFFAFRFGLGF
jgi:hypothetical protein